MSSPISTWVGASTAKAIAWATAPGSAATDHARAELAGDSAGPIDGAVTALLEAGKAAGQIRDEVDARDVILLLGYLTRLDDAEWDVRAQRVLTIILAGLRR